MAVLPFDHYTEHDIVKEREADEEKAKSLLESADDRFTFYQSINKDENVKYAFETMYDVYRELVDALLALHGYKTYSHEAAIAFLEEHGYTEHERTKLDQIREKRNKSKYYGKHISTTEGKDYCSFLEDIRGQLRDQVKDEIADSNTAANTSKTSEEENENGK